MFIFPSVDENMGCAHLSVVMPHCSRYWAYAGPQIVFALKGFPFRGGGLTTDSQEECHIGGHRGDQGELLGSALRYQSRKADNSRK